MQAIKNRNSKIWTNILFGIILLIVSVYYGYHEQLFARPQSIHAWRQADCASIALNYHQNGMNFFKPEVHNQTSDGGTSGYSATSEAPILYYAAAILYKVFGPHEFILRALNLLLFFLGLFYLYKLIQAISKSNFWAIAATILFFSSPLIVYYGNNYLTNVSALSLAIIAWFHLYKYVQDKKQKQLIWFILLSTTAGLLKVDALMSLFAIAGYFILENIPPFKKNSPPKIQHKFIFILGTALSFSIILGWIFYAHYFNKIHECYYFSTTIFPIWELSKEMIVSILQQMRNYWFPDYFHSSSFVLFSILFVYLITQFRKLGTFQITILALLFIQSLFFSILQFWTFRDHDYYLIGQYIIPLAIAVISVNQLAKTTTLLNSKILKFAFVGFLAINIHHSKGQLNERYNSSKNEYFNERPDIYEIEPFLRAIGIDRNDKIIYIPDASNVSLYLMNQKGWTQYSDARFNKGERIKYNADSTGISKSIDRGAKYLIVNSIEDLVLNSYLKPFTNHLKAEFGKVLIYDLCDTTQNVRLETQATKSHIFCNAELVSNKHFVTNIDSIVLGNAEHQTSSTNYEGSFCIRLQAPQKYGMTFKTKEHRAGDIFKISVYRKGNSNAGIIAASGAIFYRNKHKIIETGMKNGWEKIQLEFVIPQSIENNELGIYLYNPDTTAVFFDNFEIKWFDQPRLVKTNE